MYIWSNKQKITGTRSYNFNFQNLYSMMEPVNFPIIVFISVMFHRLGIMQMIGSYQMHSDNWIINFITAWVCTNILMFVLVVAVRVIYKNVTCAFNSDTAVESNVITTSSAATNGTIAQETAQTAVEHDDNTQPVTSTVTISDTAAEDNVLTTSSTATNKTIAPETAQTAVECDDNTQPVTSTVTISDTAPETAETAAETAAECTVLVLGAVAVATNVTTVDSNDHIHIQPVTSTATISDTAVESDVLTTSSAATDETVHPIIASETAETAAEGNVPTVGVPSAILTGYARGEAGTTTTFKYPNTRCSRNATATAPHSNQLTKQYELRNYTDAKRLEQLLRSFRN
jgi:hypothetical protein